MEHKKYRVVVIGCGAIAQRRHLPEYAGLKDVQVVAVVDRNLKRAEEIAGRFKVTSFFKDYRQALKLKPDIVSVCTPNAFHAEHAIAALKAGAHVLVEKPMAATIKEARAMIAAAKAAGRKLMIGHNQRFNASHVRGKSIYKSGSLGRCLGFATTFAHPGPESWSVDGLDCNFFKKREAVMGSMADLGVHKVDLLRWLLEEDFVQVAAMYDTLQKPADVEDIAFAVLKAQSGAIGQMYAGWTHTPGCDNSTVLYCEKGQLRLEDDPAYAVIVKNADGEEINIKTQAIQTNEAGGQYRSGVIDSFLDSIRKNKPVAVSGEDAARSLATVLACMESGKTGRFVKVPRV